MEYHILRSKRKTISIQIRPDGEILVRCPLRMREKDVHSFVQSKADWISAHLPKEPPARKFTEEELEILADQARSRIPQRVRYFAPLVGVDYGRITIGAQHTRWGSCSARGNLNFNCLLVLTPPEVMDYVVVHELCHRKELNHAEAFWTLVEQVLPDYREKRKWLTDNGGALIARLP